MTFPGTLKFEKKSTDIETIFLNHYDWLLDWARQHTQGAKEEAEDLVQDLYVRFVQMKIVPAFKDEDEIRAYLYTSLKNLFISKKLRSGRDAVSGLLAVDFDSVEYAMSSVNRSQLLLVRSDLAGICEYACLRRRTSRAGSVLVLRFFLGYLPTEIMELLRTKRSNLDTLVETARLEAKAYLTRRSGLRFLNRDSRRSPSFPRSLPEQPEALFLELQRRVFSEAEGICLPPEELQDRYLLTDATGFSTQEVAHLASCRVCLGLATRVLGLPDLTHRSFSEGEPSKGSDPPSARTGTESLKKLRRKLRETYEHRPKKLQIVVDGEVRGVQTITGASSNFQIALPPLSRPGFVEVLSEQGLGLLYFDLQQGKVEVPAAKIAEVDLSDARQLWVSLTLVSGAPLIEVSYYDPLLERYVDGHPSIPRPLSKGLLPKPRHTNLKASVKPDGLASGILSGLKSWRPWFIAVLSGLCLLPALMRMHLWTTHEAPQLASASLIASRSIDPQGKVQEFSRHNPQESALEKQQPDAMWQHPPNAADFEKLAGEAPSLTLRPVREGYEVSFQRSPSARGPSIVDARLIVAPDSLRPIAETLRVQDGTDTTDYRFREVHFETLSQSQVKPSDFVSDLSLESLHHNANKLNLTHLALEVLRVLSSQQPSVQSAVDVQRRRDGSVEVMGVVPTKLEAKALVQSLRGLGGGGSLRVILHASDESTKLVGTRTTDIMPTLSIEAKKIPFDGMLRDALSSRLGSQGAALDKRVQDAARDVVQRSARIHRATWVISQIGSKDFLGHELQAMNEQDRKLWLFLLARPLSLCEVDLHTLSATLSASEAASSPIPLEPIPTVSDLSAAADLLREHAEHLDKLLVYGFTVSTGVPTTPVSQTELLELLTEVQCEERRLALTVQLLQQEVPVSQTS